MSRSRRPRSAEALGAHLPHVGNQSPRAPERVAPGPHPGARLGRGAAGAMGFVSIHERRLPLFAAGALVSAVVYAVLSAGLSE